MGGALAGALNGQYVIFLCSPNTLIICIYNTAYTMVLIRLGLISSCLSSVPAQSGVVCVLLFMVVNTGLPVGCSGDNTPPTVLRCCEYELLRECLYSDQWVHTGELMDKAVVWRKGNV